MGYTHYWKITKIDNFNNWDKIIADCKKIIKDSGIPIAGGDGNGKPKLNDKAISFNGAGDEDSHETFYVKKDYVKFAFCKTARKPYDIVAVACLVVLKNYLKDNIEITSDGDLEELQPGIDLCMNVLGYACNPLLDETDEIETKPFDQMNFEDLYKLLDEIRCDIEVCRDDNDTDLKNGEEYGRISMETVKKIKKCLRYN